MYTNHISTSLRTLRFAPGATAGLQFLHIDIKRLSLVYVMYALCKKSPEQAQATPYFSFVLDFYYYLKNCYVYFLYINLYSVARARAGDTILLFCILLEIQHL